ncbi:MAG: hypothetical protein ACI3YH_08635 [Eubacteriales bacterium]
MRIWKTISNICAHLSVIWSLMLLTFYITDRYNTAMAFINHEMTKGLVAVLSLSVLLCVGRLLTDRQLGFYSLRWVSGILAALFALASASLLILDHSMADRFEKGLSDTPPLLFTGDAVKAVLAWLAVTAIFAAIVLIVLDRRMAGKEQVP